MVSLRRLFALAALAAATSWPSGPSAQPLPLRPVADIALGAPTQRFDYESLDPKSGLLFVADLAGGRVLVIDVRKSRLLRTIPGTPGVHGVLAVPEQGRVYAAATARDEVATIDEASLAVVARTPGGHYPDGIAWAPRQHKLYVSDEHGDTVGVIDPVAGKLLRTISVGGDVGNTQFDGQDGLIYTNEQTTGELLAIDPDRDVVVSRWPLPGCRENHGLLIDARRRLAYIACQGNARLLVFSLQAHTTLAAAPIGADPDVLAADFGLARLYVAGEAGVVSVFDISGLALRKLGEARLANNAHVVAVDPASHKVFFPLRNVGGRAVMRVMEPAR
jgi:YVTN family beta-propeller protein